MQTVLLKPRSLIRRRLSSIWVPQSLKISAVGAWRGNRLSCVLGEPDCVCVHLTVSDLIQTTVAHLWSLYDGAWTGTYWHRQDAFNTRGRSQTRFCMFVFGP